MEATLLHGNGNGNDYTPLTTNSRYGGPRYLIPQLQLTQYLNFNQKGNRRKKIHTKYNIYYSGCHCMMHDTYRHTQQTQTQLQKNN